MKELTKKEIQDCIDFVWDSKEGTAYIEMGEIPDGRKLCLVFGWTEGYEKGEDYQDIVNGTVYTLCCKLAVNIDDLQCDFDIDWYMPWGKKDGDVWDTMMAVTKDYDDYEWYEKEAKEMLEAFEKGEIEVK
jgi:hypothetical protein